MKDKVVSEFVRSSKDLKKKVRSFYLFGSRAEGRARPDSDYDLLCIVNDNFRPADRDTLYEHAMDILLKFGAVLSLKIFSQSEFDRLAKLRTPFIQNVLRQRVRLG